MLPFRALVSVFCDATNQLLGRSLYHKKARCGFALTKKGRGLRESALTYITAINWPDSPLIAVDFLLGSVRFTDPERKKVDFTTLNPETSRWQMCEYRSISPNKSRCFIGRRASSPHRLEMDSRNAKIQNAPAERRGVNVATSVVNWHGGRVID